MVGYRVESVTRPRLLQAAMVRCWSLYTLMLLKVWLVCWQYFPKAWNLSMFKTIRLKRQCMANVNNSNVYMYKPKIDQYERVNSLGVINLSKIKSTIKKTRSIRRTQTPPRLWPLTCDRDLLTRSRPLRLFNITLLSWQRWCLSILVNTCLNPSGDILCQRKNSIFIRSIFSKAVQTL